MKGLRPKGFSIWVGWLSKGGLAKGAELICWSCLFCRGEVSELSLDGDWYSN